MNGHIEDCLSSLGLAIELELYQYSLDHRALFVFSATTRLILSLFLSFFSSISLVFKGIQILPAVWRKQYILPNTHKACLKVWLLLNEKKICVGWRPDYRSNSFAKIVFPTFATAQDNHLFFSPECGPSTGCFKIQLIKDYMSIDLTFFIIVIFIYMLLIITDLVLTRTECYKLNKSTVITTVGYVADLKQLIATPVLSTGHICFKFKCENISKYSVCALMVCWSSA